MPAGWTATLIGGGQPVAAAMPATNSSVSLELRLDVPKNAADRHRNADRHRRRRHRPTPQLPIAVTLAKDLPAKLTLTPQLPELRGTSKSSFEYQLAIKNDSGKKLPVSLSAQTPQNFDTSFTEDMARQELNAVPIDAGQTKNVKLKVTPPNTAAAGSYKVVARVAAEDARATADLAMDITGQPKLDISGREGLHFDACRRRQGDARCRSSSPIPAPRRPMTFSSSARRRAAGRSRSIRRRRPHRAECKQGSAGADHADRQGDRRRLHDDDPRLGARRVGIRRLSASP